MSVISSRSLLFSVAEQAAKTSYPIERADYSPSSGKLRDDHETTQRSAVALLRVCNGRFGPAVAADSWWSD